MRTAGGHGLPAGDRDLAGRLLGQRVQAYEQNAGPKDTGSTDLEEGKTESGSDTDGLCVLSRGPTSHEFPSGCGSLCGTCRDIRKEDGRQ